MTKKLIHYTVLLTILLLPVAAATSDYRRPEPTNVWKQINTFLNNHKVKDAYAKSWYLSKAIRPYTMAAITFHESGGTLNDVKGSCGEVSAFQILKPPRGFQSGNFYQAQAIAEHIFEEKRQTFKHFDKAIQGYNGNPKKKKTKVYLAKISILVKEIRNA